METDISTAIFLTGPQIPIKRQLITSKVFNNVKSKPKYKLFMDYPSSLGLAIFNY